MPKIDSNSNRLSKHEAAQLQTEVAAAKTQFEDSQSKLRRLVETLIVVPTRAAVKLPTPLNPHDDIVELSPAEAPSSRFDGADDTELLVTDAARRLEIALARRGGTTIGLSGVRGVGKTTLARTFSRSRRRNDRDIGVYLAAPVSYDIPLFLHTVLKKLCLQILRSDQQRDRKGAIRLVRARDLFLTVVSFALVLWGLALVIGYILDYDVRQDYRAIGAALIFSGVVLRLYITFAGESPTSRLLYWGVNQARHEVLLSEEELRESHAETYASELLSRVEYTEKYVQGGEAAAGFYGLSFGASKSIERSRTPLSEVDIPDIIEQLVGLSGATVTVAIDELDKMPSDDQALAFLNRLKPLFHANNCSFILSVSEAAWAQFEHRGIPFRDAYDSSLDEVVQMSPLSPRESRDLLRLRMAKPPTDVQVLLCHCISGGLPRDLLRSVRLLARHAESSDNRHMEDVAEAMLDGDVEAKFQAAELRLRSMNDGQLKWTSLDEIDRWRGIWHNSERCTDELSAWRRKHLSTNSDAAVGRGGGQDVVSPSGASRGPVEAIVSSAIAAMGGAALEPANDAPSDDDVRMLDLLQDMVAFLAISHTIREIFTAEAKESSLGDVATDDEFSSAPVVEGIARIANARRQLSFHHAVAWKTLDRARTALRLVTIEQATTSSS